MRLQLSLLLIAAATAACDAPAQHNAEAASAVSQSSITLPKNNGLIPGTPAGDLGDWVKDIRTGLAAVGELTVNDAAAAQRMTLDLYVTRQEYAELYYGIDGRNKASMELSEAIETAEEKFHALMQLLVNPTPIVADVNAAITAVDEQQALVAEHWQKTGVTLKRSPQ